MYVKNLLGTFTGVANIDLDMRGVRWKSLEFYYNGASATMQVWGGIENIFVNIGADITADALREVNQMLATLRVRCSAYVSGTVTVWIGYDTKP